MEINEMTLSDIETRAAEIEAWLSNEGADVETLTEEVEKLEQRKREILAEVETRKNLIEEVKKESAEIPQMEEFRKDEIMEKEVRNTKEYIDAYAEYIRTGNAHECRALLTENGSGTIPVPELVYDVVKTAWERDEIMALVRKSYLKGNLKVGFEISATDAVVHTEGNAVNEEQLVLGIVNIVPQAIKKWVSISDEALDMTGEAYLRYIYDELTYKIAKKCASLLLALIDAAGTASTATAVGVPTVKASTIALGTVAKAMAKLSAEAQNPVVIMNRETWGDFKDKQYAANFNADPFEGLRVIFDNSIKTFTAATTGDTYAIVGDLGYGALANFPNGEEITVKRDDYTLATSDLVRFIGREYVGLGLVAPNAFVKVIK